jgi:hypothetical protein
MNHIILISRVDETIPQVNAYLGYVKAAGLLDGCGFLRPAAVKQIAAKLKVSAVCATLSCVHVIEGVPQLQERWDRDAAILGDQKDFSRTELSKLDGLIKLD